MPGPGVHHLSSWCTSAAKVLCDFRRHPAPPSPLLTGNPTPKEEGAAQINCAGHGHACRTASALWDRQAQLRCNEVDVIFVEQRAHAVSQWLLDPDSAIKS